MERIFAVRAPQRYAPLFTLLMTHNYLIHTPPPHQKYIIPTKKHIFH